MCIRSAHLDQPSAYWVLLGVARPWWKPLNPDLSDDNHSIQIRKWGSMWVQSNFTLSLEVTCFQDANKLFSISIFVQSSRTRYVCLLCCSRELGICMYHTTNKLGWPRLSYDSVRWRVIGLDDLAACRLQWLLGKPDSAAMTVPCRLYCRRQTKARLGCTYMSAVRTSYLSPVPPAVLV